MAESERANEGEPGISQYKALLERASAAQQQLAREHDRLKLLLDINNAVVSHLGLDELLHAISESLQRVVPHDLSSIGIYDAETDQLCAHVLEYKGEMPYFIRGGPIPLEGTTGGEAFTTGQPVFIDRPDLERFNTDYFRKGVEAGLRSGGNIPLIAHGRKLGVLGVASFRENAFSEDDIELLCRVASEIAIAVENSLNYERARNAERRLARSLDQLRLLLDVSNSITSHLDLRELFKAISVCLRKVIKYDGIGMRIYDPESGMLRVHALDPNSLENLPFEEGEDLPVDGTPAERVIKSLQTVVVNLAEIERFPSPLSKRIIASGIKSGCVAPLVSHGRALGTLDVASLQDNAFTREDAELITQIASQIAIALDNALAYREIETLKDRLSEEKLYLEEEINTAYDFEQIIGSSPALKRILKQVETVAPTDSTVLIQGETGTGKELIARAIHSLSGRRERTLVKLNCAAIPTGLLESELFGHEKGAFTGAIAQRIGRFELANKGTLFLDEVGEIQQELQPKLLRVLQEKEFERLGSTRTVNVDLRLIAATNRNLEQMVAERRFRDDLFYRLNVFPITIPPLRERHEDIPLLVRFFASRFARRMKKRIETIPAESVTALQQYHWPGNIRELENFIERAVILTQGTQLHIPLSEMKPPPKAAVPTPTTVEISAESASLESFERDHILRVLRETDWVVGGPDGAAARLGLKRTTLQARMKRLGIARHRTAP